MMDNGKMPAMPSDVNAVYEAMADSDDSWGKAALGLTKRELMAMHAMVGLLSCGKQYDIRYKSRASQLVEDAVFYANALLGELERTK